MFSISIEVSKRKSTVQTLEKVRKSAVQTLKSSTQKALYRHSKKVRKSIAQTLEKDVTSTLKSSTQKTQKEIVFSTYTNQYPLSYHPVRAYHSLYLVSTSTFSLRDVDEDLYVVRHFQSLMSSSTQVQELYLTLRALFQSSYVRQRSLSFKYDKDSFHLYKNSLKT